MKNRRATMAVVMGFVAVAAPAEAKKCSADAVQVQAVCVDKYEASVWETTDAKTVKNIQKGKICSAKRTVRASAPTSRTPCGGSRTVSTPFGWKSGSTRRFGDR